MSNPQDDELGTLVIVVLKAKDLIDRHTIRKQDAFATISLNGETKTTKVDVKGGQHPLWDEEFRIPIRKNRAPMNRELKVACFSKEARTDDPLGQGSIDISETLQSGEFDDWVPIQIDGSFRGEVYLEMTFYSSGPAPAPSLAPPKAAAPLMRRPSKLSPADRMSRPQTVTSPQFNGPARQDQRPQPPSQDVLVPNLLRPGGGHTPPRNQQPALQSRISSSDGKTSGLKPVPTLLRPGGGHAPSTKPSSNRLPSGQLQTSRFTPSPAPSQQHPGPHPYNYASSTPAPQPHLQGPMPGQFPGSPTLPAEAWRTPDVTPPPGGFLFPTPDLPGGAPGPQLYQPPQQGPQLDSFYGPDHPMNRATSPPSTNSSSSGLPDPYLQARYQTPLPLPPGATSPPQPRAAPPLPAPSREEEQRKEEEARKAKLQEEEKRRQEEDKRRQEEDKRRQDEEKRRLEEEERRQEEERRRQELQRLKEREEELQERNRRELERVKQEEEEKHRQELQRIREREQELQEKHRRELERVKAEEEEKHRQELQRIREKEERRREEIRLAEEAATRRIREEENRLKELREAEEAARRKREQDERRIRERRAAEERAAQRREQEERDSEFVRREARAAEDRAAKLREQEEKDAEFARQLSEMNDAPAPPRKDRAEEPRQGRSRGADDYAARLREQEEKDMALARQLDQELNVN